MINPGQLGIVREIVDTGQAVGTDFDTAVFSDTFDPSLTPMAITIRRLCR